MSDIGGSLRTATDADAAWEGAELASTRRRARLATALAFVVTLAVCLVPLLLSEHTRVLQKQQTANSMVSHHGHALHSQLSHSLSATYALAAVLRQGKGQIDNFDSLAGELLRVYGHGISALQLAPDGVIRRVAPLAGNEPIIGHDLFKDRNRNKEAFLAVETRRLTLAGPFKLVQGGMGMVGRLPVFLPAAHGGERFWGFTTVLIRVPNLIEGSHLAKLSEGGYQYELSRIHPDTGQRDVFARSGTAPLVDPIRYDIDVPNGKWTLSMAPSEGWHSPLPLALEATLALVVSVLVAFLIHSLLYRPLLLDRLVKQRTRELAASNTTLEAEVWERQQAEAKLREQVHLVEQLLEAMPSPIFYKDDQGRYLGCNKAFEAYLGKSKDELIGKSVYDVAPTDLADIYHAADQALLDKPGFQVYEASVVYADGTQHDVVFNKATFSRVNGSVAGLVGLMLDITERKRMEAILRESEARFRHIYDYAPAMMFSVDADGRIVDVNRQWMAETGYGREEAIGMAVSALQPADAEDVAGPGESFWEAASVHDLHLQLLRKDGGVFEALLSAEQTVDPSGIRSSLVVADNLTSRQRNEQRLRVLSRAVEQSPAAVVITGTSGRIEYVNPQFCHVTGYDAQEVLDQNPRLLKSGYLSADEYAILWGTISRGAEWRGEMLNRKKDGELFWESATISPITDGEGRITHYVAVKEDITERKQAEQALRESEERFRQVVEQAADALFLHDLDGRLLDVNQQACDSLGYSREELLALRVADFEVIVPAASLAAFWERLGSGQPMTAEGLHRRKDGREFPVEVRVSGIHINGERLVLALARDVSERQQTEARLRLAARVFESTSEGIMVTDADGVIQSVNPAFTQITGYQAAQAVGRNSSMLRSTRHNPNFYRGLRTCLNDRGQWQGEIWKRRASGEMFPAWMNISAIKNDQGEISSFVVVFSDITGIKETEERLYHLAHHDALTDLPNRLLFHDLLQQAINLAHRKNQRVGVLFMDLDRFKFINDTLGHEIGDEALRAVSQRLTNVLREGDTIARLGGDEFTVLLPELKDERQAGTVARKILEALSQPFQFRGQELYLTTSIGISIYPNDGTDGPSLIKHADAAMYRAKEQGRNNYQFYTLDMNAQTFERLALEASMRHALKRGEFVLHYQPQVDMASGRVTGAEALLRWLHPQLGLVSPAQFIPIAEETGLIVPIGEWVLRTACIQARAWQDRGLGRLRVAVNVSARQFRHPTLVDRVAQILEQTRLPPELLELELTENLVMETAEKAVLTLQRLKAMGVRLAIDDFGTGYSSLGYLKRFPIDTLKIDRSFVQDILADPDDATITTTIIRMAHSLKLKVVAEGVETVEQLGFLRNEACDEMQGFYFSRPLAADGFEELMRKTGEEEEKRGVRVEESER